MIDMREIHDKLHQLALSHSRPFCYSCYRTAPTGRCVTCGSDDLMREVPSVGVEYGLDWVRDHLVESNVAAAETDAGFVDSIRECYGETVKIGWIEVDVATTIQQLDPVSWRIARSEWIDQMLDDGLLVSFDHGSTCYWTHDVEKFIVND